MALNLRVPQPNSGSGDFELAPEGSHCAILAAVIELGTSTKEQPGQPARTTKEAFLVFELIGEVRRDNTPFYLGRNYTASLNEKASLRAVLKALRGGRDFTTDEDVDLKTYLGKPCIVSVEHKTSAAGRQYARISGVQPPMKGQRAEKPSNDPIYWEIDSGEPVPEEDWLPYCLGSPVKHVIEQSNEWRGIALQVEADEAF